MQKSFSSDSPQSFSSKSCTSSSSSSFSGAYGGSDKDSASAPAILKDRGRARFGVSRSGGVLLVAGFAWSLVSCNNDKIEVYNIPKEGIAVAMRSSNSEGLPPASGNPPQWTKPEGWTEQPLSEMRLGSFKVDGSNTASADVSVIAFPGEAGGLISNINRWRGQLQLPPLGEDQLPEITQRTEVDNVPTYLVDFQTVENAPKPSRILGAVLQTADRTWFVKMTGPPGLIESQRDKFLAFVKSFHFTAASVGEPPAAPVSTKPKSTNDE
jgi:hypothetical protein